jgi:hypothetical protein
MGMAEHPHCCSAAAGLIGLAIAGVIVKITWDSWWTVRGHHHAH